MIKQSLTIFMLRAASFQSLASLTLPENEHDCFVVPDGIANVGSPVRSFVSQMLLDRALITTELNPDHPLGARVYSVDAFLDIRSGAFGVRLKLPNKENAITAGQQHTTDFDTATRTLAIAEVSD